jgi:hypothetical protein
MFRRLSQFVLFIFAFTTLCCSGDATLSQNQSVSQSPSQEQGATTIARSASEGFGTVTLSSSASTAGSVIVLEERHNSRVGQLQHAITLVRLHNKYGLKDIVLDMV